MLLEAIAFRACVDARPQHNPANVAFAVEHKLQAAKAMIIKLILRNLADHTIADE